MKKNVARYTAKPVKKHIVDVGIAAFGAPDPAWYVKTMAMLLCSQQSGVEIGRIHSISSAVPDYNKNKLVTEAKERLSKTDMNRVKISGDFLSGDAEWLFQIDDDTTPPQDALIKLLKAQRDFIAGIYFNPKEPHNPIAYVRGDSGLYSPLYGYPKGTLVQVDSVGMGCTLIHRSVFQKIYDEHRVFQRQVTGSIFAIHNSQVTGKGGDPNTLQSQQVRDGMYSEPVIEVEKTEQPFPFYAMEYARTEDHHFCELAANIGSRPWVDTNIICGHWKLHETTNKEYEEEAFGWMKK